jgi:lysophospholipase L1-like esterase
MRIAFIGDSLTAGKPGSSYFAILRTRLASHTLVNLGRGNDTVVSLYRRLTRLHFGEPFDIAFLWIGVNDVALGSPWTFQAVGLLKRQPRSRNRDEFRAYYQATLELLRRHAHRVVAVSMALKGEDVASPCNRELEALSKVVQELASHSARTEYLDVRTVFTERLAGKRISNYLPSNVIRVALDALTLRSDEQIDKKSAERGLHLTLDGIHLNSAGAQLVADCFMSAYNSPNSLDRATACVRLCTPSLP